MMFKTGLLSLLAIVTVLGAYMSLRVFVEGNPSWLLIFLPQTILGVVIFALALRTSFT